MHEDRRRAHQAEAHQGGLHRAADPAPAGEGPEGRHHESLADDVQHAVVVEEGPEGKLSVLSEKRRGQGDGHGVEEGEPGQEAMARAPDTLREGSARWNQGPEAFHHGRDGGSKSHGQISKDDAAPPERRSAGLSRTWRSAATWRVISVRAPGTSLDSRRRDEFPERARRCCICLGCLEGGASCATACTSWTATVTSWISRIAATRNIFPSSTAGGSPSSRAPSGTAARPPTATWAATPTRRRR